MRRAFNKVRPGISPENTPLQHQASPVPNMATSGDNRRICELVMVYDADGSLSGELIYITKKWLGFGHCAACTISHGPMKEKPEFTALKQSGWGVPLRNIHRDEMDHDLHTALHNSLPCIAARCVSGDVVLLLGNNQLDECSGDVETFRSALDNAILDSNLMMPSSTDACVMNTDAVVPGHT